MQQMSLSALKRESGNQEHSCGDPAPGELYGAPNGKERWVALIGVSGQTLSLQRTPISARACSRTSFTTIAKDAVDATRPINARVVYQSMCASDVKDCREKMFKLFRERISTRKLWAATTSDSDNLDVFRESRFIAGLDGRMTVVQGGYTIPSLMRNSHISRVLRE